MGKMWVKDGTKKSALNLRLSEHERNSIDLMARLENRTTSEMIRALIREGAKSRAILLCEEGKAGDVI